MTSSSSLYGTVTQQNSSSANSTGLYGDANTPIPDASGNLVVRGDLYVLSGNILTTATTGNLFPTNATTVNVGLAATAVNIGSATGNTTINNNLVIDGSINGYTLPAVDGQNTQVLSTDGSGNLYWAQNFDTTYTIDATTTTGGANFNLVGNDITTDTIKFASGTGIAVTRTNGSTITFSNTGVTLPYNIDATATTGGANLNLTDGLTTDTVKFASGTNTAVTRTDANTITFDTTITTYNIDAATTTGGVNLNLTGSDSSTDTVKFTNGTGIVVSSSGPGAMTITNTGVVSPYTINASTTTGGANFNLTNADGTDTIKFAGTGATTVTRTNDSLITIDSTDTTYTQNASLSATGADLNLVGSNATTDTIKFVEGTNVNIESPDASTITINAVDTTYTQSVSANTGGANLNLVGSDSSVDAVKIASGTNVTVVATDASTMTINATDTNTTYDFAASSTTGGANLNLTGSDSTTDTVKLTNGGHVTATYTTATAVTLGSDATSANTAGAIVARNGSGNFVASGATLGNVTAGIGATNLITTTSGALNLDSATGSIDIDNATLTTSSGNVFLFNGVGTTTVDAFEGATNITMGATTGNTTIRNKLNIREIQSNVAGTGPGTGLNLYSNNADKAIHLYDDYVQIVSGPLSSADWTFNPDGSTNFPYYKFPSADGTANQVLTTDGAGNVYWALPGGGGSTFGNVSIGVVTDNTVSTTTGALDITAAGTNSVNITSGSLGPTLISRTSSPTNTNIRSLGLNSQTSGTPAVGIGNSIEFSVETATGVTTTGGYLSVTSTDITPGAEDFKMSIGLMDNGAVYSEVARFESTGNLVLDGRLTSAGGTLGNVTVGVDSDQAISTTSGGLVLQTAAGVSAGTITLAAGANGAITVAPNGTGNLTTTFNDGGNLTNNRNYVFGAVRNATQLAAGDIGFGNLRGISLDNSSATTKRPGIMIRSYGGGLTSGAPRSTIGTEAARGSLASPANLNSGDVFGEWIGNGYTSTGWSNEIVVASPAIARFSTAEAWDSGTAKVGARFQVVLMPASTTYSTANLRQVLDVSPDTFNTTSDLYTLKNKANTTNLTLSSTGDLVVTGDVRINGNNILGSGGLAAIDLTSANTVTTVRGNTTLLNTAADATYASISGGGQTFTSTGRMNIIRTTPGTGVLVRQQTTNAGPVDGENTDFRLSVAGTVTSSDFARFDGTYKSSGDNEIGLSISTDSFVTDTDRIYIGSRAKTQIQTTPAGGGTVGTTAEFTQLATTIQSDQLTLQTAAGAALPSGKVTYGRQYLEAYSTQDQTNPVANAENLMSFNNTGISNGVSVVTNGTTLTRITFANAGVYNLQFSAQLNQTTGGAHNAFIWLKKNGANVANTAGDTRVAGNGDRIMAAWNYIVSAAAGDYYELAWSATDTNVLLDYVAASAPVPAIPSVILTVVPVGA